MSEQYLQHHGVLGMKWGVRRYQNKDGSYKSGVDGRYNDAVPKSQQGSGSGAKVTARAAYKNSVKKAKQEWSEAAKKYADSTDGSYDRAADKYLDDIKKAKAKYKSR